MPVGHVLHRTYTLKIIQENEGHCRRPKEALDGPAAGQGPGNSSAAGSKGTFAIIMTVTMGTAVTSPKCRKLVQILKRKNLNGTAKSRILYFHFN